jgi:hypothetical protein
MITSKCALFWRMMCFTIAIEMTLPVRDAPGHALKIHSLSFHGCRYRQPFSIQRCSTKDNVFGTQIIPLRIRPVAAVAIERPAALPVLGYLAPVLTSVIVVYMNRK